jgi:hypothetical protein
MNFFAPVAIGGFWVLLVAGWLLGELRFKGTAIFILLWLGAYVGSGLVPYPTLFVTFVAVLDIALALIVFRGDVRLR